MAQRERGRTAFGVGMTAGILGLIAVNAAALPAAAASHSPAVVVSYADLDLTTARGAEQLYARLQQAAQSVCPQVASRELSRHMAQLRCQNAVVEQAVMSVHSPKLAEVFAARAHHDPRSPV